MESGGNEVSESGEQRDLLASRFVKGSYCAYSFILTVVIAGIGQLIATLVLEPCRAAARHRSQVSTVRNEIRVKNWEEMCMICRVAASVWSVFLDYSFRILHVLWPWNETSNTHFKSIHSKGSRNSGFSHFSHMKFHDFSIICSCLL